ncbi:MAG: DNA double-strand break repair nuclease NurA [Anaerolineae bacterium]|nr:DNA double-strand break repair nuclease NurA [Anaerolineae bacterium]
MPVRDFSLQRLQELSERVRQGTAQQQQHLKQLADKLANLPSVDALQALSAQLARLREVPVTLAHFSDASELPFRPIPIRPHDEPERYALIASDGSQILPEPDDPVPVAYTQVGCIAVARGMDDPSALTGAVRKMSWGEWRVGSELIDAASGERLTPAQLNAQRDLAERQILTEACALAVQHRVAPFALVDGTLLPFALLSSQAPDRGLLSEFIAALDALQAYGAVVCGYVDSPDSAFLVRTCALADLAPDQVSEQSVRARLDLVGAVRDRDLLALTLPPGHRTPIFTPGWRMNTPSTLKQHTVRACYVNLTSPAFPLPAIARLEVPAWCAETACVNQLCAVLLRQAQLGDLRAQGYPFVLRLVHAHVVIRRSEGQSLKRLLTRLAYRSGARVTLSPKARFKLRR